MKRVSTSPPQSIFLQPIWGALSSISFDRNFDEWLKHNCGVYVKYTQKALAVAKQRQVVGWVNKGDENQQNSLLLGPRLLLLFRFPLTMISCSSSTCTWQALMRQAPINELKGNHSFHWILLFINCLKASIKQNNLADASFFLPWTSNIYFHSAQKKHSINSQCLFFSATIFEPEFIFL